LLRLPVIPARHRSRTGGILHFRFRRRPVARQTQVVLLEGHRRRPLDVETLFQALLLAQPVAVRRRFVPHHPSNRTRWLGIAHHLIVAKPRSKPQELFLRYCRRRQGERPANPPVVLRGRSPSLFRVWRTHHEVHRAGDHHHRLPLAVDVPLRRRLLPVLLHPLLNLLIPLLPPLPVLRPVLVHLFQPCLLFPLPQ